jgi:hypothetical protein
MAEYRCPKHDLVFETLTDQRKPGSLASKDGKFQAHPANGHPDCPLCKQEATVPTSTQTKPGFTRVMPRN